MDISAQMITQAITWTLTGGALILFLQRRRRRKSNF
jgi:hypothetical protein